MVLNHEGDEDHDDHEKIIGGGSAEAVAVRDEDRYGEDEDHDGAVPEGLQKFRGENGSGPQGACQQQRHIRRQVDGGKSGYDITEQQHGE